MTDRIDVLADKLGAISVAYSEAIEELVVAEDEWNPLFDAVAEALREEYREAGRKSDPAEHTVLSATRHRYPAEYARWRHAKREVQKLEVISQNRRSELSGHQTQARGGKSEGPVRGITGQPARRRAA